MDFNYIQYATHRKVRWVEVLVGLTVDRRRGGTARLDEILRGQANRQECKQKSMQEGTQARRQAGRDKLAGRNTESYSDRQANTGREKERPCDRLQEAGRGREAGQRGETVKQAGRYRQV